MCVVEQKKGGDAPRLHKVDSKTGKTANTYTWKVGNITEMNMPIHTKQ